MKRPVPLERHMPPYGHFYTCSNEPFKTKIEPDSFLHCKAHNLTNSRTSFRLSSYQSSEPTTQSSFEVIDSEYLSSQVAIGLLTVVTVNSTFYSAPKKTIKHGRKSVGISIDHRPFRSYRL
jgi:hypothetical protein